MYFRRFYDESLAQASYLIGCQASGDAIVIDPSRVVEDYVAVALDEGLRITRVAETHIHADFVSGLRELAARTAARMYVSDCGPPEWRYDFRDEPKVTPLRDRDRIAVGNVEIEAVHTPGHTPEHLSFLVTDRAAASEPMGIVTGDFVFVGDVGRPDLLEKAAGLAGTAASGARALRRSLEWFATLPDHLQVWPGHGAGSACGKGLGAVPQSTVGYERRFNWALAPMSEDEFVSRVLAGQPEPPAYFARMKRINREGPPVLGGVPVPPEVDAARLGEILAGGGLIVDTRPTADFATGHVPGTINIPISRNFPTYAGSLLPYDRDLHLILAAADPSAAREVAIALRSIGLDRQAGWFAPTAVAAWRSRGGTLGTIPQTTVADLAAPGNRPLILDVRNRSEWNGGHVAGATLIPLPELLGRLDEIPTDRDIVVHCQGGSRSSIAASVLKARGWSRVSSLAGGFGAWAAAEKKVES